MRDSNNDLAEILEIIDPETFLEYEGVVFKRTFGSSGQQLNVKHCPRCGGASWKVYLNADTGLGNCFHGSCVDEPGFNIFSFARAYWGSDPADTIQKLKQYAQEQGWVAKRKTSRAVELVAEVKLPDSVELPYKDVMPKYLARRGITSEMAEYFNLRYCSKGQFIYHDGEGKRRWQNYDKRIIIPIFDLEGTLSTFQGRDVQGTSERKYLFPPGLPGSARYLYNGHNAIGCEEIVMAEGAFDVIACKMAMDEDVSLRRVGQVGSFGKHLSHGSNQGDDQLGALLVLKRAGLKRVTIMWDGEARTLRDAIDAARLIKSIGLKVMVAILPQDKDPNEVSAEQVRQAYYGAVSPYSSKLLREIARRGRAR